MMNHIKIIGITGRKYAGKDTLGNYFVEQHGFERLAYADPLKEGTQKFFGFTHEQLYGNEKEVIDEYWGITPRQALQFVGTNLFRDHICELLPAMGKDFWINVLKRNMETKLRQNRDTKIVITDVDFPMN